MHLHKWLKTLLLIAGSGLALAQTSSDLDKADTGTDSWLMYNKGYLGSRYSTLDQINTDNAKNLKQVCTFQLGTEGTFQPGPVVYQGVMYITTLHNTYALDAKTCKARWTNVYKPSGPETFNTNRGVAIYEGKLYRGTQDGVLLAIDAKTGKTIWKKQELDPEKGEFFSAAPIVWNDRVYLGMAGADWGVRGQMYAFSAKDGSQVWKFDLIPTGEEDGAESWKNPDTTATGGGSSWTSYSLDTKAGLLYVPVGNPAPDFSADYRPGDNLFTDSMIVLDAKTGELKWWHQLVPHDYHDWDTTNVALFDTADGKKLVATVGKDGVLHVLDRGTHKLLYKVPVTTLDIIDAPITTEGTHYCPGTVGGVEWNGPAYDPKSNTIFVNSVDWCVTAKLGEVRFIQGQAFTGLANGFGDFDDFSTAHGWTKAIDATTGKERWSYKSTPMIAAVTPTAGGVVFTGDLNGNFLVLSSSNGNVLYKHSLGENAIAGGVVTYQLGGKQYVAVAAGNSSRTSWHTTGKPTIAVYALP